MVSSLFTKTQLKFQTITLRVSLFFANHNKQFKQILVWEWHKKLSDTVYIVEDSWCIVGV